MRQDKAQNIYTPKGITNPELPVRAHKLMFFSSCLDTISLRTGEFYHYELENHISLLDHLIFIANCTIDYQEAGTNHQYPRFCFHQIKDICKTHPLFFEKDLLLTKDDNKKDQILELLKKIEEEEATRNIIENLSNIRTYLLEIKELFGEEYFESVIDCLYNKIQCKHTLKFHQKDFEYLARIIFSLYYFKGYARKMICTFVDRILTREIDLVGNKIYTEAYLPLDLYERQIHNNRFGTKKNPELVKEINSYLENRTLEQQIKALNHILHYEKYEHHLVFRLEGIIIFEDKVEKELNTLGLKIIRITDFKEKYSDYDLSLARDIFENPTHSAIVEIKVAAYSMEDSIFQALKELEIKLGKIMRATHSRFSINRKYYAMVGKDEKEVVTNSIPEIASVGKYSVEALNKLEDRIELSTHSTFYYELESILQKGYLEDDLTASMHYYRKFIEILNKKISPTNLPHRSGTSREILETAYLLLFFERNRYINETRLFAHNRLINTHIFNTDRTSLPYAYRQKVRDRGRLLSAKETLGFMGNENVHSKYELRRAMQFNKQVSLDSAFEYYVRQLMFIKQYRDKHEHANISDETIARKLGLYTYRLLNQLLRDMFFTMDSPANKNKLEGDILKEMILKAKSSLNP